ncbi:hypothetical protein K7X08_029839 [Anisodus acutangulus]|uniref:HhH-GPD domain-containing protein n=1 Tax=Anisodus acutangulus TaxID=402998 RepID=A0A9Q1M398_9SOLA|nr:hypothetical protein K7X08_029839 [Anisodus acutangulus]
MDELKDVIISKKTHCNSTKPEKYEHCRKAFAIKVRRVLAEFFSLCPNAVAATEVAAEDIENLIRPLGLYRKRSLDIQRLSQEHLGKHVTQLHGIGKYAADAYAIFCTGKWDRVHPEDHMLTKYWEFLHELHGNGSA